MNTHHILLIDDSEATQVAISDVLTQSDYILSTASSGAEGLSQLEHHHYDLILLDNGLPDTDGLRLLEKIVTKQPDLPIVMVTGSGSERLAVNALKGGASDYVVKSNDFIAKLPHIIRDNLEKWGMRRRNRELETQLRDSYKQLKQLNTELEEKARSRTEELERAYQLSNELMAKAVDSNMQLAELYSEVDESRRKLDAKIRELSLLNDVGRKMATTLDQDTLLPIAIDSMYQELEAEHCAILLLNPERNRLHVGASRGTPDDLLLAAKSLNGQTILLDILRKGQPVLIQDIEANSQIAPLARDFPGAESCILVPLRTKQFELGIFTLYGYDDQETFTQDKFEFVSALANQTAIALGSVRLFEQRIHQEHLGQLDKISRYLTDHVTTSLDVILSSAETLQHEAIHVDARHQAIDQIMKEAEHVSAITHELTELSRSQHGPLNLQTISIPDLIQQVLAVLEPTFAAQELSIKTDLAYTETITIDVDKITRVFLNIAENARQAMSPGGTLTITSRSVRNGVQFECIDTGCGMSSDLQAHLFEPFISGKEVHGSGLGLALVKRILEEHHARIELESVLAKGTIVRIVLPRIQHVHNHRHDDVKVAA